ncbi:hypothetical protein ABT297_17030 [Dactylosporangium sp. NPDC000555]|uniref:hypothetical protein n=1 Tax=Dactylosporangium sp. NPDC000555 TaxID=3154260 RepID=UPI00331C591B
MTGQPATVPTAADVFGSWTPDGVVFDCHGLLVETEPGWSVAEAELFARRGLPFGVEEKRRRPCAGRPS